jgi:5'-methylthioadenosine phosphorylase
MLLIVGGTGTYFLDLDAVLGPHDMRRLDTPYGEAGAIAVPRRYGGAIGLASRHGWGRLEVSPPFVNSRANLWAARELGVDRILGWNGVGAINLLLEVHDLLVLDRLLDFTKTRRRGWEAPELPEPPFGQLEEPFDPVGRAALIDAARRVTPRCHPVGAYACSEGPRLETAAEIAAWGRLGAEVAGMTLVPEVLLAREMGISWAALAYVTNYATGVQPGAGDPRFFGVEVAQQCLAIALQAAGGLVGL